MASYTAAQIHDFRSVGQTDGFAINFGHCAVYVSKSERGFHVFGYVGKSTKFTFRGTFATQEQAGLHADKWAREICAVVIKSRDKSAPNPGFTSWNRPTAVSMSVH